MVVSLRSEKLIYIVDQLTKNRAANFTVEKPRKSLTDRSQPIKWQQQHSSRTCLTGKLPTFGETIRLALVLTKLRNLFNALVVT